MIKAASQLKTPMASARELTKSRRIAPEQVAVFYISGQQYGSDIANYYQLARSIPDNNVISINYSWDYLIDSAQINIVTEGATGRTWQMLAEMSSALLNKNIHAVVLAGYWPKRIYNNTSDFYARYADSFATLAFEDYITNIHATAKYKDVSQFNGEMIFAPKFSVEYSALAGEKRATQFLITGLSGTGALNAYGDVIERPSAWMRLPLDHETQLRQEELDNPQMVHGDADLAIAYITTRLSAPYVHPSDTANGTSLDVVKRMIDDAIFAEQQQWTDLPGAALISGTTTGFYIVGAPAYYGLVDNGFDSSKIYYEKLNDQETKSGSAGDKFPVVAPVANLPNSNTQNVPTASGFTKVNNVFMQVVGDQTYYSASHPYYNRAAIEFMRGGIAGHAQSYGAVQAEYESVDVFEGTYNIDVGNNPVRDAADTTNDANDNGSKVKMQYTTDYAKPSSVCSPYHIWRIYDAAVATSTVEVTAQNEITLSENGVSVAVITLSTGHRIVDAISSIVTGLPAGWHCSERAIGGESRCSRALLNGACVSIGSAVEPRITFGYGSGGYIESLLVGDCLAESLRKFRRSPVFSLFGAKATVREQYMCLCVYGDPLYRPFGKRGII